MPTASHDIFDSMMPNTITVKSIVRKNEYGEDVADGSPVSFKCLFDESETTTRNTQGDVVMVGVTAYINTDGARLGIDDKYDLGAPYGVRKAINVQHHLDMDGAVNNVTVRFD